MAHLQVCTDSLGRRFSAANQDLLDEVLWLPKLVLVSAQSDISQSLLQIVLAVRGGRRSREDHKGFL